MTIADDKGRYILFKVCEGGGGGGGWGGCGAHADRFDHHGFRKGPHKRLLHKLNFYVIRGSTHLLHYSSFNIPTKRFIALSVFLGVEMVVKVCRLSSQLRDLQDCRSTPSKRTMKSCFRLYIDCF